MPQNRHVTESSLVSQYKIISGVRYERDLLEEADRSTEWGRALTKESASMIWDKAMDGNRVTATERRTVEYIISNYKLDPEAEQFLQDKLYKTLFGVRYVRDLLEEADRWTEWGRALTKQCASKVWNKVDGNRVTPTEKATIEYIISKYKLGKGAKQLLQEKLNASPGAAVQGNEREAPMLETQSEEQDPKNYMIFIGNPAVGKSTIMGAFFKEEVAYGPALGSAITKEATRLEHPDIKDLVGLDIPGIDDQSEELRIEYDKILKEELRHGGSYQIVFVMELRYGRIIRHEIDTIRRVLLSLPPGGSGDVGIPEDGYGIIVNKVEDDTWSKMEDIGLDLAKETLKDAILDGLPRRTKYIYFQRRCDEMSYGYSKAHNRMPELQHGLTTFLTNLEINVTIPSKFAIQTLETIHKQDFLDKIERMMQTDHQKHVQEALETHRKEAREFNAELQAKMHWRHPAVKMYTLVLAIVSVLALLGFVWLCYAWGKNLMSPTLALGIPSIMLNLGQLPRGVAMVPMTVWEAGELRERTINLTLDFWQLYELCVDMNKEEGSIALSSLVLVIYTLSVAYEIAMCNIGYHARHSEILDKLQVALSVIVAIDSSTPTTLFAVAMKIALEWDHDFFLDRLDAWSSPVMQHVGVALLSKSKGD